MIVKTHGSNSHGNFYTIEDQGQILLLEAGIHIKDIKRALNFDFSKVVGCIVSHEHNDHAKSISNLLDIGVPVGSNEKTMSYVNHHRKFVIQLKNAVKIGGFAIKAFKLVHDVENYGYLIQTPSGKRIVFATDTQYVMNQFSNVDLYMLECNFDLDSMRKAVHCGKLDNAVLVRVSQTHMSLETVTAYLEAADLSKTKQIMLIHLSDNNSNEQKYVDHIQGLTGIKTIAANVGDVVTIGEGPGF